MSQILWARAVWMEGVKTIEDTIAKIWINGDKRKVKIVDDKRYFLLTTLSSSTKVKPGN